MLNNTKNFVTSKKELEKNLTLYLEPEYKENLKDLCLDFGLNFESIWNIFNEEGNKIILGEQLGSWLKPSYLARINLLKYIMENNKNFNIEMSGLKTISNDTFTVNGSKKEHNTISHFKEIGDISIIPQKEAKFYSGKTYDSIKSPQDFFVGYYNDVIKKIVSFEKMSPKEELSFKSMGNTFHGYEISGNFDKSNKLFNKISSSKDKNGQKINPLKNWAPTKEGLFLFLSFLQKDFLETEALKTIEFMSTLEADSWFNYFKIANENIYGQKIEDLNYLFNEMMFLINDPIKLAKKLHNYYKTKGIEKNEICISGKIIEKSFNNQNFKTVSNIIYDISEEKFFLKPISGEKTEINWHEIQDLAVQNMTTGPSGLIEYLIIMSLGYFLIDDGEEVGFDSYAKDIYSTYFGMSAPIISIKKQLEDINLNFNVPKKGRIKIPADNIFGFYSKKVRNKIEKIVYSF